jgi:hypothetical protein
VIVPNAPTTARGIFVSEGDRHLVAIGAHDGVTDNPRNIAWSDQEDRETWTPSATNSAGSNTVSGGELGTCCKTRLGTLIVSTTTAYLMRFIGGEFVFAIDTMADNCGVIGPKAIVDYNGIVYWMSHEEFFYFDGAVAKLDCDLRSYVFDNANALEGAKFHAGLNKDNQEVWFFYVTEGTEISRYVAYNVQDKTWFLGPMIRTTWLNNSVVTSYPIATDAAGMILLQENGTTDNGDPIDYFLETNEIDQANGENISVVRKVIPDYERCDGDHSLIVYVKPYLQTAARTKGPYVVNDSTGKLSVRARGRSFKIRLEGSDDFRMGLWRADVATHGKRS